MTVHSNLALVALVDPSPTRRDEVGKALMSMYRLQTYADPSHALPALKVALPDVLLVDDGVTSGHGAEFIRLLRQDERLGRMPIVFIAHGPEERARAAAQKAGTDKVLVKPYRRSALVACVSGILNEKVEERWEHLPELQKKALKGTVETFNRISDVIATGEPLPFGVVTESCKPLVDAINNNDFKSIMDGVKYHDNYSYAHSMRVATLLSLFGRAAGIRGKLQEILAGGGLLHDAGKMSIPHEVLNKPGRLDEAEFAVMKSHVTHTVQFLDACEDIHPSVRIIASQHHEKIDGSGYPNGLKGGELNELARMAAIVDVFSALTDRRVYKPPMDPEEALNLMSGQMKNHLDQYRVGLFREMLLDAVV